MSNSVRPHRRQPTRLLSYCRYCGYERCSACIFLNQSFHFFQIYISRSGTAGSLVVQVVKNPRAMQENLVWFLGGEDLLEKETLPTPLFLGFPDGSNSKESACNVGEQVWFLGWEDPAEEGMQPTPVFLPGESHRQRRLVGYSPWGLKESDTTEQPSTAQHRVVLFLVF